MRAGAQWAPKAHTLCAAPGPPSSHSPSLAYSGPAPTQVLGQPGGSLGGSGGGMAAEALRAFSGDTIAHVGEWRGDPGDAADVAAKIDAAAEGDWFAHAAACVEINPTSM